MKCIIIDIEPNSFIATLENVSPIEALGIFEYFSKKTYEKINSTTVQSNDIKQNETIGIKEKKEFLKQPVGKLDISVRLYNSLFRLFTEVKGHFITREQFENKITALDILTSGFDYKKVRNAGWWTHKELVDFFAENGFEYSKPVPAEYL